MKCTNPRLIPVKQPDGSYQQMLVPCGQCMACRVQRTMEWSLRIMEETDYHDFNTFVTLTYDDAHLPADQSLHKDDCQLFFKRLRSFLPADLRIKYYLCGEYGEQFGRPHYHAIIFGLSANDPAIERSWTSGFVKAGTVTYDSAKYVAGYIQKKLTGKRSAEYGDKVAPFSLMSKGIGKQWMLDNEEYLTQNLGLTVKGVHHGLPRYFKKNIDVKEALVERAKNLVQEECKRLGLEVEGTRYIVNDIENKQRDLNLKSRMLMKKRKL